jgi:hypothetical protein
MDVLWPRFFHRGHWEKLVVIVNWKGKGGWHGVLGGVGSHCVLGPASASISPQCALGGVGSDIRFGI